MVYCIPPGFGFPWTNGAEVIKAPVTISNRIWNDSLSSNWIARSRRGCLSRTTLSYSTWRGHEGLTKDQRQSESKILAYIHESDVQADLILSCFAWLDFPGVVCTFFTNGRQDPHQQEDYALLYCDACFTTLPWNWNHTILQVFL